MWLIMKKSVSILFCFLVMILSISAVSAADMDLDPELALPKSDVGIGASDGEVLADDGSGDKKSFAFKIVLSPEFAAFCQSHAVPINYTVYKNISSPIAKDIYAWLVYRNNSITEPLFIPRHHLVEQFNPVDDAKNENQENVSYFRIIEYIKEIKEKHYPELKVSFDQTGEGITLYKSKPPIMEKDTRYALITADI